MLEAAAEQAPLIGQIRSFLAWVGPGRKLTATGRIGLADARHLVELLGTGDTIDPEIGGRFFKTQSSEELAYLSRIVGWAKAARLVRVTGTKLAPVKKNAALTDKPLDLVLALLEAYPRLGQPLFPRNTWRASLVGDEFTDLSQALITALLRSAGRCPLDDLNGIACDAIEARYMLADLTEVQHDSLRRTIEADVTVAMAALHVLGLVVLDREAGSAELTELGRYAVRRVRGMAQPGDPGPIRQQPHGVTLQLNVTMPGRRNTVPSGELFGMRIRGYMRRGQPGRTPRLRAVPSTADARDASLDPDYQAPIRREGGPGREVDAAGDGAVPDEIGEGAGAPEELHRSGGGGRIVWAEGAVDLRQGVEGAAAVSAGVDAPYGKDELSVVRTLAVAGLARQHGVGEGSRSAERARRREGLQYRSAGP